MRVSTQQKLIVLAAPLASWLLLTSALANPPSTADIVVYIYAVGICQTEEGYASSEQGSQITTEMLEEYSKNNGVDIGRITRITELSDFGDRIADMIKGIGGCKELLDRRSRMNTR